MWYNVCYHTIVICRNVSFWQIECKYRRAILRPDSFALRFLQKTENDMLSPLALPQGIISSEYALKISDLSYQRSFYV